ncbi:MAG: isocitrate lyase/phosphoenolpyruvate mutase family protein [Mizugakiibacter sp.]|uniref:isocitrate lyase/PEP mutase family protein n=1 Tax=Mizugakiibacter sp. TaxID=1972610 RepID=UPI0031C84D60|nr:isocitrate lyase/phosphoenolpyruvate mutase family protein [Xanthomonadaceae bacterium]
MSASSIAERRAAFRRLHERGCFVIPNAWDPGSARGLQQLGFAALASTSAGYAFSRARADGVPGVEEVLAHLRDLVAATPLPVNADFEDGHARDPGTLAANVRRCVDTGVAGLSIEDSTGDAAQPLYPLEEAVARMRAARAAIDAAGGDVLLVGRAECFLVGHPDPLNESLRRLRAYAEAGADCLFAPGLRTEEQIAAVVAAVAPKPVNVLVGGPAPFDLARLAELGVRRVSVGGGLYRAAWAGFMHAARGLAEGRFDGLAGATPHGELDALFRAAPRG